MVLVVLVVLLSVVHGMHAGGATPLWSCPWKQRNAEKSRDKDHERIEWLAKKLPLACASCPLLIDTLSGW